MTNRVTHFDIQAENPEKLTEFYKEVFNWKFQKWNDPNMKMDYWLIMTGDKKKPGIDGGLSKEGMSVHNTIDVKNIDEAIKKIKESGGKVIMDKSGLSKVGWFATFKDPQGNVFGLMQTDKKAM